MSALSNAPVIIKRKKVIVAGGHHGGAWKVAYADFVTAMMAFFMLMWLLNATTEKQRKGLADYFNPTIPVNRISGGGDGSFGGDNIFSEDTLTQSGTGGTTRNTSDQQQARGENGVDTATQRQDNADTTKALKKVQDQLLGRSGESMVSNDGMRHIVTRVTDLGLIVELFDTPGSPLFEPGTDTPTDTMRELSAMIAGVFGLVKNQIAVNGFVRAHPLVLRRDPSWDLSMRRAQATRELIESDGVVAGRVQRVTGYADHKLAARDPMAVRNNRLELILLRKGK